MQIEWERSYYCGLASTHEELLTVKIAATKTEKEQQELQTREIAKIN
jgi:hypothetical protein